MKVRKYMCFLFAVLMLASCVKHELELPAEASKYVLKIKTNYTGFVKPLTRGEGIEVGRVEVFLLDNTWSNVLTESATIDLSTGDISVELTLDDSYKGKYRVAIIVNPPEKFFDGTDENSFADITWNVITNYSDMKSHLNTPHIDENGIAGDRIPMSGISGELEKADFSAGVVIGVKRMVAKVVVEKATTQTDFELLETGIANAPKQGYFFSPTEYPTKMRDNTAQTVHYKMHSDSSPMYLYESRKEERTAVIVKGKYQGNDYYYRLEMPQDYDYKYSDIDGKEQTFKTTRNYFLRNCIYTYKITQVNGKGYTTLEDAQAGGASNRMGAITATIDVTDLSSHDIVDNGEYYLGLTNSEYIVYADNNTAITGLTIATFNHTAPTTAIIGSVEGVSNVEIVKNTDGVSWDIKATVPANFTTGEVTVIAGGLYKKIKITRKPAIDYGAHSVSFMEKYYVYGEIKNMNGNWMSLAPYEDFDIDGSLSLVVPDGGIVINISPNIGTDSEIDDGRSADVYLSRYDNRGRLKVHITQKALNLKDIDDKERALPFDPVIGAFWKKNQTGERLIRIERPKGGELDGYWFATIIQYGNGWNPARGDGVIMDTEMTLDRNVGWRVGADESKVANGNDDGFDKTYYVPQNKTVQGYLSDKEDGIYFRVGLQQKLPAGLNARYAVILLIYTYTPKGESLPGLRQQRIFLRQGDDADYLYGTTTKWMPYNLTDPSDPSDPAGSVLPTESSSLAQNNTNMTLSGRTSGNGSTDHWSMGTNVAKPCDYPSQGGYFFSFRGRYSFNPIVYPAVSKKINTLTYPNNDLDREGERDIRGGIDYDDVCPKGYHTPSDYSATSIRGKYATPPALIMNASESEVRSSLFKNPNGYDRPTSAAYEYSELQYNQCKDGEGTVVGVYADGFMDRRKLTTPQANGFFVRENSAVALGTTKAAYVGRLFFNPETLASIFFPYSGSFAPNLDVWRDVSRENAPYLMGEHAVFGTSTNRNETSWWINGYHMIYVGYARGDYTDDKNVSHPAAYVPQLVCVGPFANFSLANIRCVKDNTSGGN